MSVPRVYALGNAPVLSLVCHEVASLRIQPKVPEVVLLLQDQKKLNRFLNNDSKLTIQTADNSAERFQQFMASCSPPVYASGQVARVENLIVGESKPKTFSMSLKKYSQCIDPNTNILLLNPAFGLIEYLYKNVWVDRDLRPNLFIGEIFDGFGITQQKEFALKFTGYNEPFRVSPVPKSISKFNHQLEVQRLAELRENNQLIGLLDMINKDETSCALDMITYSYGDLLLLRYENLIVNCCINPLVALFDCQNSSELLHSENALYMIKQLIHECVRILLVANKNLSSVPNSTIVLNESRLRELVLQKLKANTPSKMIKDINLLNRTDINNLNGYFTKLAKKRNISCTLNDMLTCMIKSKVDVMRNRVLKFNNL